MSLIVMHLRWDDVDEEQYEHLCRVLPVGAARPPGCLMRSRQRQRSTVVGTEVWIDESHAGAFLTGLPGLLAAAGLHDPQRAVFAVPDCFAAGYGVFPARTRVTAAAGPPPVVPGPREPGEAPLPDVLPGARRMVPSA